MTRRHKRPLTRCGATAVIFLASLLLVLSFIFFEVLDVDGSDLPKRLNLGPHAATLAEVKPDIRRAALTNQQFFPSGPLILTTSPSERITAFHTSIRVGFRPAVGTRCRPMLARAALADLSVSPS